MTRKRPRPTEQEREARLQQVYDMIIRWGRQALDPEPKEQEPEQPTKGGRP